MSGGEDNTLLGVAAQVGRIEGKLGEVAHEVRNLGQRTEAIGNMVHGQASLPQQLVDMKTEHTATTLRIDGRIDRVKERVEKLERGETQRETAVGIVAAIFKSPLVPWLAFAAAAIIAFFERVQP